MNDTCMKSAWNLYDLQPAEYQLVFENAKVENIPPDTHVIREVGVMRLLRLLGVSGFGAVMHSSLARLIRLICAMKLVWFIMSSKLVRLHTGSETF